MDINLENSLFSEQGFVYEGFIYIFSNPTMPGIIKIGKAKDVEKRLKSISNHSGIPLPFKIEYKHYSTNAYHAEMIIHSIFQNNRVDVMREFFYLDIPIAIEKIEMVIQKLQKEPYYFVNTFSNYAKDWNEDSVRMLINDYLKINDLKALAKIHKRTPNEIDIFLHSIGVRNKTALPNSLPSFIGFPKGCFRNGELNVNTKTSMKEVKKEATPPLITKKKTTLNSTSKDFSKTNGTFSIDEVRKEHPKAYSAWTDEEENLLTNLFNDGYSQSEIAKVLQRQSGGIRARLKKLKLTD